MPCKHTMCAHTHARAQTLPLLPCMDPDRAPLAQAQSIQRWRQRDAFIPVKPCPVSRAMEPCPWPPMPHSLQAAHGVGSTSCPHLCWKTLLAPGTKTSGVCVLWPDTSATLLSGLLYPMEKGPSVLQLLPRRVCRTELQTSSCHGSGGGYGCHLGPGTNPTDCFGVRVFRQEPSSLS